MSWNVTTPLKSRVVTWLMEEEPPQGLPLSDYDRMANAIRPGDVLLVEGRSRISRVIKAITQSPWSHAALYLGSLNQVEEPWLRKKISDHISLPPDERLIVEAILGQGVILSPLSIYRREHIRICRPRGITDQDVRRVITHAINRLGHGYDIRQILDLARLLLPYGIIPRRWRSSLFGRRPGPDVKTVCACMLAEAFMSVHFPIVPVVQRDIHGQLILYPRNSRLHMPRDFDHSPYFEIVKYPLVSFDDMANYHTLPWDPQGLVCDDTMVCHPPHDAEPALDTTIAGRTLPLATNARRSWT
ncbi:MAG: hypothetical protein HQM02_07840 [Magnetococcales bacterium]|nr:hypothetical protein [Magnetococcales bacterium]